MGIADAVEAVFDMARIVEYLEISVRGIIRQLAPDKRFP
jgi:hypothetical protein